MSAKQVISCYNLQLVMTGINRRPPFPAYFFFLALKLKKKKNRKGIFLYYRETVVLQISCLGWESAHTGDTFCKCLSNIRLDILPCYCICDLAVTIETLT